MENLIEYQKGGNKGSIMEETNGLWTAVTAVASKSYKTLKGAQKFMDRMGYEEV